MSFRDSLNQKPAVSAGVLALLLGTAGWLIYGSVRGSSLAHGDKEFYSTDEGATSFVDRATREPPFDHNGAEAVRVHYFTCDGGKTRFVGWLEKYSPEAKAALTAADHDAKGNLKDPTLLNTLGWDSKPMVKRPTDPRWFKRHEVQYEEITTPKCPEGVNENSLAPVEP